MERPYILWLADLGPLPEVDVLRELRRIILFYFANTGPELLGAGGDSVTARLAVRSARRRGSLLPRRRLIWQHRAGEKVIDYQTISLLTLTHLLAELLLCREIEASDWVGDRTILLNELDERWSRSFARKLDEYLVATIKHSNPSPKHLQMDEALKLVDDLIKKCESGRGSDRISNLLDDLSGQTLYQRVIALWGLFRGSLSSMVVWDYSRETESNLHYLWRRSWTRAPLVFLHAIVWTGLVTYVFSLQQVCWQLDRGARKYLLRRPPSSEFIGARMLVPPSDCSIRVVILRDWSRGDNQKIVGNREKLIDTLDKVLEQAPAVVSVDLELVDELPPNEAMRCSERLREVLRSHANVPVVFGVRRRRFTSPDSSYSGLKQLLNSGSTPNVKVAAMDYMDDPPWLRQTSDSYRLYWTEKCPELEEELGHPDTSLGMETFRQGLRRVLAEQPRCKTSWQVPSSGESLLMQTAMPDLPRAIGISFPPDSQPLRDMMAEPDDLRGRGATFVLIGADSALDMHPAPLDYWDSGDEQLSGVWLHAISLCGLLNNAVGRFGAPVLLDYFVWYFCLAAFVVVFVAISTLRLRPRTVGILWPILIIVTYYIGCAIAIQLRNWLVPVALPMFVLVVSHPIILMTAAYMRKGELQ